VRRRARRIKGAMVAGTQAPDAGRSEWLAWLVDTLRWERYLEERRARRGHREVKRPVAA
jgi:hypothetical protein